MNRNVQGHEECANGTNQGMPPASKCHLVPAYDKTTVDDRHEQHCKEYHKDLSTSLPPEPFLPTHQ
eukprot:130316-Amphidinium_carterae.1